MKKLIFTGLTGLAMIGFTGCTNGTSADVDKNTTAKCAASGKCSSGKCGK